MPNRPRAIEPGYVDTESVSSGYDQPTPTTETGSFAGLPAENE